MLKWPDVLKIAKDGNPAPARKVVKTEAEWRQQLTDEQYRVTRQAGTERAFSSGMCSLFEPGLYSCVCCDTLLFDSNEKFESHTGWPSFTQPIGANVIAPLRWPGLFEASRDGVQHLRSALGSRVSRRPKAKRFALLHECRCAQEG